jgi:hypothetical protein
MASNTKYSSFGRGSPQKNSNQKPGKPIFLLPQDLKSIILTEFFSLNSQIPKIYTEIF